MSQTSAFFNKFYTCFESKVLDDRIINVPDGSYFGVFNLNAVSCRITEQEQEFVFVVDRSASMSDQCSDGRTKMHHITHTLKNMIIYFHENRIDNIHLTVFAFDDKFVSIIERARICECNLQEILAKIDYIHPNGSTDIELALQKTSEYIIKIMSENPEHNINHIFMTDGDATCGNTDHNVLKGLVIPHIENAFIGFGINHDSALLTHISDYKNSSYHFIDAIEKSGLIYGEILHGILYKYLTDCEINVKNGLIYDYKKNQWVNKLFIGTIVGEANKTYHLISTTPNSCSVILSCANLADKHSFEAGELHNPDANNIKYVYRQRTLELLFDVSHLQKNRQEAHNLRSKHFAASKLFQTDDDNYWSKMEGIKEEERKLKQKLRLFFDEIKQYMSDNNLSGDNFLKNLCDDVYVAYQTLGTKYGAMYSAARQTSQGAQRCYTVSETPLPPDNATDFHSNGIFRSNGLFKFPKMCRQTNGFHSPNLFGDLIVDDYQISNNTDELHHNLSSFDDTPYLTPIATRIMRDVSSNGDRLYQDELDHEEEKQDI